MSPVDAGGVGECFLAQSLDMPTLADSRPDTHKSAIDVTLTCNSGHRQNVGLPRLYGHGIYDPSLQICPGEEAKNERVPSVVSKA